MIIVPLPKAQSRISDQSGVPTREWYNYFRAMLESAEGNPALEAQIQAILVRLEALEDGADFTMLGIDSVQVFGTPSGGLVKITLANDVDEPGATWHYSTGPDGVKGWHAVSDSLAADAGEITKTVDPVTGVTSFGLESVNDSGTGALLAITKDGFGRVIGTKPATITGTTGNVTVANGDAVSGLPTINLSIVPDGGVASALLKVTRDSFGRVDNTQAASASDVPVEKLGSATWDNVQEAINVQNSPGLIDGGSFSDAGGGNLFYAAMHIAIRPTDSDTATLYMADIAAGSIAIPNDSATRFVGVQYNAGTPNVIIKTADSWDYDTEFPLGEVANLGGTLFPLFNPYKVGDPITNVIQRFDAQAYAIRSAAGGLELSTDGTTRNLAMTAGVVWTRLNDHPIAARNSPTFPLIRVAPTGGTPPLSFTPGITAWPNTQYISGITITTMGNNKWANLWVFVNIGTGAWGFAHGTAEYNNSSSAAAEAIPAYLTSNFLRQNIFVGRLIFEKNATTAIIESAFTRVFSTQAVSNHNQLSGLQGGVLNEYYHLTSADVTKLSGISPGATVGANWLTNLSNIPASISSLAGLTTSANQGVYLTASNSWATYSLTAGGRSIGGVAGTADTFPYFSASNTASLAAITSAGRALIDDADASTQRATLGFSGGTTGQFWRGGGNGSYSNRLVGPIEIQTGNPGTGLSSPAYQLFTDNQLGIASIKALRGPNSSSTGIVFQPSNSGTPSDTLFISHDGRVGIGAIPTLFQFEIIGSTAGVAMVRTGGSEPFFLLTDDFASLNGGQLRGLVTSPGLRFTNRASSTEFWRISPNFLPGSDNLYTLGDATRRPSVLFAASGTINTSDAREKTTVRGFSHSELAAASELCSGIGVYQWLAMVEAKGDEARQHIGLTVQQAIAVLESHGLDPFSYGFICYDEWGELPEVIGEDGEIAQEYRPAGDRYSFRMDELLAFVARGLSHRLSEIERRLDSAGL